MEETLDSLIQQMSFLKPLLFGLAYSGSSDPVDVRELVEKINMIREKIKIIKEN